MKAIIPQAVVFGIFIALVMILLKFRNLAIEHFELFGKKRAFITACPDHGRHISAAIVEAVFWSITGSIFYLTFWHKYLPLW